MQPARVIVCEKSGQWAAALRHGLTPAGQRVHETRSWAECWNELALSPASLLALELTRANDERLLQRLAELTRRFRRARAIVVGERELAPYEWAVREAGAIHAVFDPQGVPAAVRLIERHLARAPQPQLSMREAVWRRLPWSGRRSPDA